MTNVVFWIQILATAGVYFISYRNMPANNWRRVLLGFQILVIAAMFLNHFLTEKEINYLNASATMNAGGGL
ncbi:MAG TPA: hypothetical protein VMI06_05145 [Terriglobia bacterium]|nr:hypothetical protein [Terriglobia bacterium]